MAEVAIEMADIQTILNASPAFAQAVQGAALARRVDELEAAAAAAPVCGCQKDDSSDFEPETADSFTTS
jgi:hypothetical protein